MTENGQEAITHLLRHNMRTQQKPVTLSLDMSNAYNSVLRSHLLQQVHDHFPSLLPFAIWAYGQPNTLTWEGRTIEATRGIKQGDPLSSFWFALCLKEPLEKTQANFPDVTIAAYLDDIALQGDCSQTRGAFHFLKGELEKIGLQINGNKTQLLALDETQLNTQEWTHILPIENITRPSEGTGIIILGVPFGDAPFQRDYLRRRLITENQKLAGLRHAAAKGLESQVVMRLLSNTIARQPTYWLRTLPCEVTEEPLGQFSDDVLSLLRAILKWDGELPAYARAMATFPVKAGGLSILLQGGTAEAACIAGAIDASKTIADIAGETEDPLKEFTTTPPTWLQEAQNTLEHRIGLPEADYGAFWSKTKLQKALAQMLHKAAVKLLHPTLDITLKGLLTASSAKGAAAWLYAAPWKGHTLDDRDYTLALRLRLGLPLTSYFEGPAGVCCNDGPIDERLHHGLGCGQPGAGVLRVRRHNDLAAELEKFMRIAEMPVEREVSVDPKNVGQERPIMDLIAKSPTATIYLDVSIPNPLTATRMQRTAAKPLSTAVLTEDAKRRKYHHLRKPDTEVIPFVIETTGGFGDDAYNFLKRIARKIPASKRGTRETRNFRKLMMTKLSITLMRRNLRLIEHFRDNFQPQGLD